MLGLLDWLGSALALCCVLAFIKEKRFAWLIAMLTTIINGYLYFQKGLYGKVALDFCYCANNCLGYWLWQTNKHLAPPPIRTLPKEIKWPLTILALFSLSLFITARLIPPPFTYEPALTQGFIFVGSLSASVLMTRKYIETWWLWLMIDLQVAVLCFERGIPIHGYTHLIYLGLACCGIWRWQKKLVHPVSETPQAA